MNTSHTLNFKFASQEYEFEQIFRLNYKTFVEEIPQHSPNPDKQLVDRFHHENTYLIALDNKKVAGMLAIRNHRPFSLEEKLGNIDPYLPSGRRICEIRLLAVLPGYRNGIVFRGLLRMLLDFYKREHYNLAVISGTVRQQKLYKHLGFIPFGPLIGTNGAQFQPMYLKLEEFVEAVAPALKSTSTERALNPISFLPGPVNLDPKVRAAFESLPVSHRSRQFKETFAATKSLLSQLTRADHVEILLGSGTLANDAVAGQISLLPGPGLILSNGEFGDRLIDHANRFRLSFDAIKFDWENIIDGETLRAAIERRPGLNWLWAVACESSNGTLIDVRMLKKLCSDNGIYLCLDAISWIGTAAVDLRGVYLASGVSGKGLASLAGLSMVFYSHHIYPHPQQLPRYLDLGTYAMQEGSPFTHSSNLVSALNAALKRFNSQRPFEEMMELSRWFRSKLREIGIRIVAPDASASPAIITVALPPMRSSQVIGDQLQSSGHLLSYQSEYLLRRNWIQICLMGACSCRVLMDLLADLRAVVTGVN